MVIIFNPHSSYNLLFSICRLTSDIILHRDQCANHLLSTSATITEDAR